MSLKLLTILFIITCPSLLAKEQNITLRVEGKSYVFSLYKDRKISLKEKTIDLSIEKKPCNTKLFSKLQQNIRQPLQKFKQFTSQNRIEIAKCSNGGVEKEICLFLKKFPITCQQIKMKEALLCKKGTKMQ